MVRWLVVVALLGLLIGEAPRVRAQSPLVHIVQPGENLFRIGLRYGVSWQSVMAANGLTTTYITVGQALVIPGAVAAPPPASPPPAAAPAPTPPPPAAPAGQIYVVAPGDTAWRIAMRFGVTVAALAAANGLYSPQWLYVGQTLLIPGAPAAPGRQLAVIGRPQTWPLTCEARSAADWAGYFGVVIDELAFFAGLPASDDPEAGFVGSAFGAWGQVPPNDYGVHAPPVAALLTAYGVRATAVRDANWERLRGEIDLGRPVIVWVTGHVWDGAAYPYTAASTGRTTLVAPYEHTVIVTGYAGDQVTVLDGASTYAVPLAQFLRSWATLGDQAIIAGE